MAAEAKQVGSRLTLVLLPLAAGLAGATGYTAWLQSGSHAAAYAMGAGGVVMPAAAVGGGALSGGAGGSTVGGAGTGAAGGAGAGAAGSGAAAGAGAAGVSGVVIGSVVTGVLVAAAAVTAIVLAPMVFNNTPTAPRNEAAPPAAVSTPAPDSSTAPSPAPTVPPTLPGIPPVDSASASSSADAPVSVLPGSPTAPPVAAPPAPPAAPSAPSIGDASVSPAGVLTLSGTGDPGNTVVATAQSMGGGGGGTARFAVVPSGVQVGSTTVGASGAWILTTDLSDILPNGTYTFTVVQSGASGDSAPTTTAPFKLSVVPSAPTISEPTGDHPIQSAAPLVVTGNGASENMVSATLTRVNGAATASADATVTSGGEWQLELDISTLPNGPYTLSVTQSDAGVVSEAAIVRLVLAVPPTAPRINNVDTNDGLYYPVVSGTGVPGATVVISGGEGQESDPIEVGSDGNWISKQLDWTATRLWATQSIDGVASGASAQISTATDAPPTASYVLTGWANSELGWGDGFKLTVDGAHGAPFSALGDDEEFYNGTLDAAGGYSGGWVWVGAGTEEHTISVRYDNGLPETEHRYGPSSSITFQAPGDASATAATQSLRATQQSAGVAPAAQ